MDKAKTIESIASRKDRTCTQTFKDFESLNGVLKEQNYSQKHCDLSEYQNFLYKRAMYGTKAYPEQEVKEMFWQKRNRIKKVHKRTQKILNLFKQEKLIEQTNAIFGMFSHSDTVNDLLESGSDSDAEFFCNLSFKDLNITKTDIVERLTVEGILPKNFQTL